MKHLKLPFAVIALALSASCNGPEPETPKSAVEPEEPEEQAILVYAEGDSLVFPARAGVQKSVTITAFEDCDLSYEGTDGLFEIADTRGAVVSSIEKQSSATLYVRTLKSNTEGSERKAFIVAAHGTDTNRVALVQQVLTLEENALPARWEYNAEHIAPEVTLWQDSHISYASSGKGKDLATITFVGEGKSNPVFCDETHYKRSLAISGAFKDDYYLFSVPVKELPAGTAVDFMVTMGASGPDAPKYWVLEYLEDGVWKSAPDLKTASEDPSVKYSFYVKYFSSYQHTTFVQGITLQKALSNSDLQLRVRVAADIRGDGGALTSSADRVYIAPFEFKSCTITAYPGIAQKDEIKLGILGNSFTHYHASAWKLKEIARSQGHEIRMRVFVKGSQSFANHLALERSKEVYEEGGYDYALLQETSTTHSSYFKEATHQVYKDCFDLTEKFRDSAHQSGTTCILENTWAFPKSGWQGYGTMDAFSDALTGGALQVAAKTNCWVSPIADAFRKAYAQGITDLWHTDSKHPNANGAYLKSCVNYLVIYGEKFASGVSDCDVEPAVASKLRQIAEEVVLGHESTYFIERGVVPERPVYDDGKPDDPEPVVGATDTLVFRTVIGGTSNINVNADVPYTSAGGSFTLTFSKGTNSNPPKYYWESAHVRVYSGNSTTVASTCEKNIVKIEFTTTSGYELGSSTSSTPTSGEVSGNTWTGDAQSVTFQGGTGSQFRPQSLTVYFKQ